VFEAKQYAVKFATDGNGTIKENAEQTIDYGSDAVEVEAVPNTGYEFVKWQDANGEEVSAQNPFTLTNVTCDSSITAIFKIKQFTVKFTADDNGTIKENAEQTINYGSNASTVEAVPNTGYEFVKWQDAYGNKISTQNPFTLTNVTSNITVSAIFQQLTGISNSINELEISFYPNPTTGMVNVKSNDTSEKVSVTIYSSSGINVYSNPAFTGSTIDLSGLNNGLYLVKVSSGSKVKNVKLIKE
jgi:biotin operon repressor